MHLLLCLTALLCISHCRGICIAQVRGVNDTWKQVIVKKHNELRAKVANGGEGNLPKAANMLEMVWDDTLAEKAQEWADKCEFKHDTQADRDTGQGFTGQNIAYRSNKYENPQWEMVIQDFYDEVADFKSEAIDKYFFQYEVSHFTEIIWAKTYKVGCGYVRLPDGKNYQHLYGCDYLPGGNILNKSIYERGEPCSYCRGCGLTNGLCGSTFFNVTKFINDGDRIFKERIDTLKTAESDKKSMSEEKTSTDLEGILKVQSLKVSDNKNLTSLKSVADEDKMKTTP